MSRFAILAALLVLLAAPASQAQNGPYPDYHNGAKLTAASTAINYFNAYAEGLTATAGLKMEVQHLSLYNRHATADVRVRVYTKFSPGWDGVWSASASDDYVTFTIPPNSTLELIGVCAIGFYLVDSPGTNGLYIYGWNGRG